MITLNIDGIALSATLTTVAGGVNIASSLGDIVNQFQADSDYLGADFTITKTGAYNLDVVWKTKVDGQYDFDETSITLTVNGTRVTRLSHC